jgi:hypothetical protein
MTDLHPVTNDSAPNRPQSAGMRSHPHAAAYFHLYGLSRDDAEYILTTFQAHRPDASAPDLFSRGTPILEAYDRLGE